MTTEYLDKKNESLALLRISQDNLEYLASALYATGNTVLADKLHTICSNLNMAEQLQEESFNELFDSAISSTYEASANMFKAAFSVVNAMSEKKESK